VIGDEKWPVARLIPISSASGVEAQEGRLASALLAVMAAVPDFGQALLKPLGAPSGRIQTFIEVPFTLGTKTIRPDGVIVVTRAGKTWSALVEAKVAANRLDADQMNGYLDLARELDFQAVLSISNQYVTSSSDYPIEIDRRKVGRRLLHHWSWIALLTEATVQKEYRGVSDPDQAYILGELIRYLSDPRSGAVAFEGMGPGWTAVREGARDQNLRRTDEAVLSTVARWDELVRYLALSLTTDLGREVKHVVPAAQRTPAARRQALVDSLVSAGRLHADLQIPNVAGLLSIAADLRARRVIASTSIDAPRDGTSKGRVSWLLRQLQSAPGHLNVEARVARRATSLASPLSAALENPSALYPDKGHEIRSFGLSLASNMGLKRDNGRGSFAESIVSVAEVFYSLVLEKLRAWKAPPPKLKRPAEKGESAEEAVAELIGVEPEHLADLDEDAVSAQAVSLPSDSPETTEDLQPNDNESIP